MANFYFEKTTDPFFCSVHRNVETEETVVKVCKKCFNKINFNNAIKEVDVSIRLNTHKIDSCVYNLERTLFRLNKDKELLNDKVLNIEFSIDECKQVMEEIRSLLRLKEYRDERYNS